MNQILVGILLLAITSSLRAGTSTATPTITQQPVSLTLTNGGTAAFNVAVEGNGPFTYQWQFNGTNLCSTVTTIAGNGMRGYSGDGSPATNATLNGATGIAVDNAGNLFIADTDNECIRKVDSRGITTTVAGNGTWEFSGDGGPATNAAFRSPSGVACDGLGNLLIADTGNSCIRRVDPNGIITTIAGIGGWGFSGDGGPATNARLTNPQSIALDAAGNLFIADFANGRIRKVDANGIITTVAGNGTSDYSGDGGPATNAQLRPTYIAFDSKGNLFVAEGYNNRIRKVDFNGIITTVAGDGINGYSGDGGPATSARLSDPQGIALDNSGNLFFADLYNDCVRKVNTEGIITTIAGNGYSGYSGDGGPAICAELHYPIGVASDRTGNVYVADLYNNCVRKVSFLFGTATNLVLTNVSHNHVGKYSVVVKTASASVTSQVARLTVLIPPSIDFPPTNQLVSPGDTATFSTSARGDAPLSYFWLRNGKPIAGANGSSYSITNVQPSDSGAQFSCLISNNCGSVTSFLATLTVAVPLAITQQPANATVTNGNTAMFNVAVSGTGPFTYQWQFNGANLCPIITTVAGGGSRATARDRGPATNALLAPSGIAMDSEGNLLITDVYSNRVYKVDANGIITTVAGGGSSGDGSLATDTRLSYPQGIALDAVGNLYIADGNQRVRKVGANGIITTIAGNGNTGYSGDGGPATGARLNPVDISLDSLGSLFIADQSNNRIRKVDRNGIITTVAGSSTWEYSADGGPALSARLKSPTCVCVDGLGNLYIADRDNHCIRKVDGNGIITTVAGNWTNGCSGDGGLATSAELDFPTAVALDGSGNVLIADCLNNRIRKVDTHGIITTVAGNGAYGYSGDGGPATSATLAYPTDIALDSSGNLFFADIGNGRIRKISLGTSPKLVLTHVVPETAGNYSVIVSSPYGCVTSQVARLTVQNPPTINVQPSSQTVLVSGTAKFDVGVSGGEPMSYFWMRNGMTIAGANGSSYAITNAQLSDSGAQFSCIVSNSCGSITSSLATLTVTIPPTFSQQPSNLIVANGDTAIFSVAVSGTGPFTYQWQFNGIDLGPIITTVAGTGTWLFSGDGGPATNAGLGPSGLALDSVGNLYIADANNNRIRKVDTNGIITTVAGSGIGNYSGDGGPATSARINLPLDIGLDSLGNLYFSDYYNNRIRKVDANGIITTVAGNGTNGYSGDGGPAINAKLYNPKGVALDAFGTMYIADSFNNRIRKVGADGIITTVAGTGTSGYFGDGGPATKAWLGRPTGVALDDLGNLFITDSSNNRIRKVDANGIITTVAGNGIYGYSGDGGQAITGALQSPSSVGFDRSGNLFIADSGNNCIRKVDAKGIITTAAGNGVSGFSGDGGLATLAELRSPRSAASDSVGNVFIADSNCRVRKLDFSYARTPTLILTNVVPGVAGNYSVIVKGPYQCVTSQVATLTVMNPPKINLQPNNQTVLVSGTAKFDVAASGGEPLSYFWLRNGMPVAGANNPSYSITNVQASDSGAQFSCLVSNRDGTVTTSVAAITVAFPPKITQQPIDTMATNGNTAVLNLEVSGTGPFAYQWQVNGTNICPIITTVAGNGTSDCSGNGGPATEATLGAASGTALDDAGNLFIADSQYSCIRKIDATGTITTVAGSGGQGFSGDGAAATTAMLNTPSAIALDGLGNLFIADANNSRIRKVDANGIITTVAGNGTNGYSGDGGPATSAGLSYPASIALDAAGNLFIGDIGTRRVRKVDADGIITTVAGNGTNGTSGDGGPAISAQVSYPRCITLDSAGNLLIADVNAYRIRKVDNSGIITTVAGNGKAWDSSGDGGPATNAGLYPCGIASDRFGNLFISDGYNNRIRKVDVNGIITTLAGNGTRGYSGDGGPAFNATLAYPQGVALDDSGDLFFADTYNYRIRTVNFRSAASPAMIFTNPAPADAGNYSVVVSTPYGSVTSQVATLSVKVPPGITCQPTNQTLLAGETVTFRVSVFGDDPLSYSWMRNGMPIIGANDSSYLITNVQPSDSGAQFSCVVSNNCGSVTSHLATLLVVVPPTIAHQPTKSVALKGNTAVFSVAATGTGPFTYQWLLNGTNLCPDVTTVAGGHSGFSGDGGLATNAGLSYPTTIALNLSGDLFIADVGNSRIRKVDPRGIISTVAGNGIPGYSGDGGAATSAMLNRPSGIALDSVGNLFIADEFNERIRKVNAGTITTLLGAELPPDVKLSSPRGIAFDASGSLFIADCGNHCIYKLGVNGIVTTVAGKSIWAGGEIKGGYAGDGGPAIAAELNSPTSVALDGSGNLFIADSGNNRIRKVDANGVITTVAGNGTAGYSGNGGRAVEAQLLLPLGVAADAASNLFIADGYNNCIRKVDALGIITTVVGGDSGFLGDTSPATNGYLSFPQGVAVDKEGNLFIADTYNSRVCKLNYALATTPILLITNIGPDNIGDYSVIVRSPYGCVTSSIATLSISTVMPPQNFAGLITQRTNLALQFNGATPSHPYVLQTATNLNPPVNWQAVATNQTDAEGVWRLGLSMTNADLPARFFRVFGE